MKFAIGHLLEVVWFARVPVLKSERLPRGHPEEPATYWTLQPFNYDADDFDGGGNDYDGP